MLKASLWMGPAPPRATQCGAVETAVRSLVAAETCGACRVDKCYGWIGSSSHAGNVDTCLATSHCITAERHIMCRSVFVSGNLTPALALVSRLLQGHISRSGGAKLQKQIHRDHMHCTVRLLQQGRHSQQFQPGSTRTTTASGMPLLRHITADTAIRTAHEHTQ